MSRFNSERTDNHQYYSCPTLSYHLKLGCTVHIHFLTKNKPFVSQNYIRGTTVYLIFDRFLLGNYRNSNCIFLPMNLCVTTWEEMSVLTLFSADVECSCRLPASRSKGLLKQQDVMAHITINQYLQQVNLRLFSSLSLGMISSVFT